MSNLSIERWERTKQILEDALHLAPEQRAAYLESACGGDGALRAEIQSLIDSHEEAGSQFLSAPAPEILDLTPEDLPGTLANRVIGNYRLVEEIGRGGMGQVWLAEQIAPVRRQIALKLIKVGLYDDGLLKRFQLERQSLAIMDHPSIAKVFDAGATPDGQPYFVMEFVRGLPITDYCDKNKLNIRERLELLIKVCEGVQHAHQKAIIHRDLKPANILVQEVDGKPVPRIIDFGLAKATSPQIPGETLYTSAGGFVGTPGYMSPEQCDHTSFDVDTRTDVYSLGVVLYVLLSGCLPFQSKPGKEQSIDEMLRLVREQDPPRPSTKVSSDRQTSSATAEARGTKPRELVNLLRGDLDWITMKATERDRGGRYGTPSELAADIGRYLSREPVMAHPPSVWYRGRKFLRRYQVPVLAAVLVLASLAAGLYVANRQRTIAQKRFQDVRELANKLFDIDAQARELPGSTKTRQLIVDTSLDYLRRMAADVRGDAGLSLEIGNAYMNVARVQGVPIAPTLGQMDQAEQSLRIAEGFVQSALKAQPGNRMAMLRAAQIAHDRMILARFRDDSGGALELAKQSSEWLERFNAGNGDEAESYAILNTYLNVADQFSTEDELNESLRLCKRASEIAGTLNQPALKGNFLRISAEILRKRGDLDQALSTIQQSVRLLDPGPDWMSQGIQTHYFQLALVYQGRILGEDTSANLGRPQEAVKTLKRAFEIADAFVHRDPNDHGYRGNLGTAGIALGNILRHSDPHAALDVYDHTLRHLNEVTGDLHLQRYEVNVLAGSSYPLRKLGRGGEARQRLDLVFQLLRQFKFYPADHISLGSDTEGSVRALADYEAQNGRLSRGIEMYEKLLTQLQPTEADPEFNAEDAVRLSAICDSAASLYRRAGQRDRASALEARRAEIWRQWDHKLPNNPFVQRQMAAKSGS
ncbi:MAG TPA: serine/threonine-protein kinase [Candidatus Sulfotelmatobacter sp.]|nr:serine/threonine-protein kinase [Candidatus Sulfotelmatobacter sp.]